METIKTSEYPIRYLSSENHGKIIENEIQLNRGGYELVLQYYNENGKGYVSVAVCNYAGIDFLVTAHAELDRVDIWDRKQKGFSKRYIFYEEAKKVAIAKIEELEEWVDSNIIWKMMREKYRKEIHEKAVKEYEKKLLAWDNQTKEYQSMNEVLSPEKNKEFMINSYEDIFMQGHKEAVMQAIEEGKDVPEEVRKEYRLGGEKSE